MGRIVSITGLRDLPVALEGSDILCLIRKPEKWLVEPSKTVFGEHDHNYMQVSAAFRMGRRVESVPTYVAVLNDALVSPSGVVFTRKGDLLYESLAPWQLENYLQQFSSSVATDEQGAPSPRANESEIEEREIAIHLREGGETGYFHFINSVLPKVALSSYVYTQNKVEYLVNGRQPFARDFLGKLDILPSEGIRKWLRCRTLFYLSPFTFQGDHFTRPRFGSELLKTMLEPTISAARTEKRRRVYLSRGDAGVRRLTNEEDVIALLTKYGFETLAIGSMPISEQVAVFADTTHLVSAHGAGLSNMIFMPENSVVTELVSPARLWPTFRMLAARHGPQYHAIIGNSFERDQTEARGEGNEDFSCDMNIVKMSLNSVYL
jgi:hypothetical protein